jgi:hypothetical protein
MREIVAVNNTPVYCHHESDAKCKILVLFSVKQHEIHMPQMPQPSSPKNNNKQEVAIGGVPCKFVNDKMPKFLQVQIW